MVKVTCNNCVAKLDIPDKYGFCRVRCGKCNTLVTEGITYTAKEVKRYLIIGFYKDGGARAFSLVSHNGRVMLTTTENFNRYCIFEDLDTLKQLRANWLKDNPDVNVEVKIIEIDNGN